MAAMRTSCTATSDSPNPLHKLTYKRAEFVTCPACRHGGTTVVARERLAGWRYAVGTGVAIVFAPFTLGTMLFLLPLLFRPQFVTHSCRRCGLRLAIATGGLGEYQYTIPVDLDDDHFVPASDDWRPDLARLPGGMRVARSPLGPRPEISEREMKICSKRFINMHPRARLKLIPDDTSNSTIRCILELGSDINGKKIGQPSSSSQGDAEVLYEIRASNVRTLNSYNASDASITVTMRPPPQEADSEYLPSYSTKLTGADKNAPITKRKSTQLAPIESLPSQPFTEACRIRLFPSQRRKYSSVMYIPSQSPSSSTSVHAHDHRETAHINAISARHRTQFSSTMPIWRWQSSEGGLVWVSRRFQDANMKMPETRLCLVDDYDRLVAVLDGWDGLHSFSAATELSDGGGGAHRQSVLTLYADLGAVLLGEVLGSLCTLAVQVTRVTAELKKEQDERKSSY